MQPIHSADALSVAKENRIYMHAYAARRGRTGWKATAMGAKHPEQARLG